MIWILLIIVGINDYSMTFIQLFNVYMILLIDNKIMGGQQSKQEPQPMQNNKKNDKSNIKPKQKQKSPTKNKKEDQQKQTSKVTKFSTKDTKIGKNNKQSLQKGRLNKSNDYLTFCPNNKNATMICVSQECDLYPFYCTECDPEVCQTPHFHNGKLLSLSYKQFTKKVFKKKGCAVKLSDNINSYRKILHQLEVRLNSFVNSELEYLNKLQKGQMPSEEARLVMNKIKTKNIRGLKGAEMGELWKGEPAVEEMECINNKKNQFLMLKIEELSQMSDFFEYINKVQSFSKKKPLKKNQNECLPTKNRLKEKMTKKYHDFQRYHLYEMKLSKQKSWSSTLPL